MAHVNCRPICPYLTAPWESAPNVPLSISVTGSLPAVKKFQRSALHLVAKREHPQGVVVRPRKYHYDTFWLDMISGESILMADTPYFPLEEVKRLLQNPDTRIITRRDRQAAADLGYADDDEMVARVLQLTLNDFKKQMPSEDMPGYMLDVYKPTEPDGTKLYIKLQIRESSGVIVSFKRK